MINYITSKTNERIKELVKLHKNKNREESRHFLVEGFHSVEMAYNAHLLEEVYTLKEIDLKGVAQYIITPEILDKITTTVSAQGIVGKCKMVEEKEVESNKIIYLDNISDPGNLGTILRTALAFNFKDIIISDDSVSLYNDKVLSATQGAIFNLNVVKGNIQKLLELKNNGYKLIGTSLKDSIKLDELPKLDKLLVIFGNEGNGIKEEILKICDYKVIIPIENIDSLNVGVAAGITLFTLK